LTQIQFLPRCNLLTAYLGLDLYPKFQLILMGRFPSIGWGRRATCFL
jgi:hypothetical protein